MFYKLRYLKNRSLNNELIIAALGGFVVKIVGVLLAFLLALFLARKLGPEGYGVFSYVIAISSILVFFANMGLPNLVVRETARASVNNQWPILKGLWIWSILIALVISLIITVMAFASRGIWVNYFTIIEVETFLLSLALIPTIAINNLRSATLRGFKKTVISQLPDQVLRPIFFVIFLTALENCLYYKLNSSTAIGSYLLASLIALVFGGIFLRHVVPPEISLVTKPTFATKKWLGASIPLAMVSGMQVFNQNIDILLLGLFDNSEEVGIYKATVAISSLVIFGQQALNITISPYISSFFEAGNTNRLQRLMAYSSFASLLFSLPITLIFVLFSEDILKVAYGPAYISGSVVLVIVGLAQLINSGMGSVGMLLTMTGHEQELAKVAILNFVINLALNLSLIPLLGMEGAAIATALTLLIWNISLRKVALKKLGIESTVLGMFKIRNI